MKIKIRTSTYLPTIRKYSNIAIKNYLWAQWGMMVEWFEHPREIAAIALAYTNGDHLPIGAAVLLNYEDSDYNFGVFVDQSWRRNGVGTNLVKAIQKRDSRMLLVDNEGSYRRPFYKQFGL